VIGAGANVFGTPVTPKYVPPFAWGCSGEQLTQEGFLTIARRVLARRDVPWSEVREESLRRTYQRAGGR
jgi:hypothetical protein